jgi:hypothetical protein
LFKIPAQATKAGGIDSWLLKSLKILSLHCVTVAMTGRRKLLENIPVYYTHRGQICLKNTLPPIFKLLSSS